MAWIKRIVSAAVLAAFSSAAICTALGTKYDIPLDITERLLDLGVSAIADHPDTTPQSVVSRNPYDMASFGGRVYVSHGNYQDNTGPVTMYCYQNESGEATASGVLPTEQVDELFAFDGCLFALETDPKDWAAADVCYMKPGAGEWSIIKGALKGCIHCYDMVECGGSLFFCGAAVETADDGTELTKAAAYRLDKSIADASADDFSFVPAFDRNGEPVTASDTVPRYYEMFVFKNELYALLVDSVEAENGSGGAYRYDRSDDCFRFCGGADTALLFEEFYDVPQDCTRIAHDFEFCGSYYFLLDTLSSPLYRTADLVSYEKVTVPGHRDAVIHDCFDKDGKKLLLASEKTDGGYMNYVFSSADLKNFRLLYYFSSPLYARSFEYLDGYLYFGLGFQVIVGSDGKNHLPDNYTECGRILRVKAEV